MKPLIYIIPGNPPVRFFYEEWKKEILERIPDAEILIKYFPLLGKNLSTEEYIEQMNSHFKESFKRDVGGREVILIGHSIGGYLALNLLEQFESISECHLLFPFLGNPSLAGKTLLKKCSLLERVTPLRNIILENRNLLLRNCDPLKNIKFTELETGIRFAHHEGNLFKKTPYDFDKSLDDKIRFYYNTNDMWCGKKTIKRLVNRVKSNKVKMEHAFILFKEQRDEMQRLIFK